MKDYYTVTEYSKITGKDPGNIRRLLIYGKIFGEKLGNQWIIPKDVKYPQDNRIKSGEYRNWRQKQLLCQNNPALMKSLKEMCVQLHDIYGDTMSRAILYGSYARGEQTRESDVDIAIILSENCDEGKHEKMVDIVVDYELELAVTLSVVPVELKQYQEGRDTIPFYKNLEKEGIIIWKTA